MPFQSNHTCIKGAQWVSSDCAAHALCLPVANQDLGICQCNVDANLYVQNDHNTCDPTAGTWIFASFFFLFFLMSCQIVFRMRKLFWQSKRMGILRQDTLGTTIVLMLLTSYLLVAYIGTRAAPILVNTKSGYLVAVSVLVVVQAIYAFFYVSTIIFLGVSFITVIQQSSKLVTGSEKFQSNLLAGASVYGVAMAVGVTMLTITKHRLELGILIAGNSFTAWFLYYLLQRRLRKQFPTSIALTNILDIISSSANRLVFAIIAEILTSIGTVLTYSIGQSSQNRFVVGPVSTAMIIVLHFSFVLVVDAMVRCIEKLVGNRQAPTADSIEAHRERKTSDQCSVTVAPLTTTTLSQPSNPQGIGKPYVMYPKAQMSISTQNDTDSGDGQLVL
jgi:large-conductance mechanosensitive channel